MDETQIELAKFQRKLKELTCHAKTTVDIAYSPRMGFLWGHGDLMLCDTLKPLRPDVKTRVVLGLRMDDDVWIRDDDLASIADVASELLNRLKKCEVRLSWEWTGPHYIIADSRSAAAARPDILRGTLHSPPLLSVYSELSDVEAHQQLFEGMWAVATPLSRIYRSNLTEVEHSDSFSILVIRRDWDALIASIAANANRLRSIGPRDFEELIANLLEREGYRVIITPASKDGGRDLIATTNSPLGSHLYLVECKHYSPNHLVGVELIRNLYGVVEMERATAGLIITSSSFTSGALEAQRSLCHRLHLKDYNELMTMIKAVAV
jgi:HJR/Mrr/RecB family endonuclease